MKLKYKIKFAIDGMLLHGKKLVGNIILCMLTILLIAIFLLINEMNGSLRSDLEKAFQYDCDKIGYIVMNQEGSEKIAIWELMNLQSIEAVGNWQWSGFSLEGLESLKDVQQNQIQGQLYNENGMLQMLHLDGAVWNLFSFSLCDGVEPSELTYNENVYYIYLGYAYQDKVDVGTVYSTEIGDYVVAGIFDKGCTIADEDLQMLNNMSVSSTDSLDYAVVEISLYPSDFNGGYFAVGERYTFDDAVIAIQQLAKKKNISLTVVSVDAKLTRIETSLENINQYMRQILFVVGITLCIVSTCFQTVTIILRKSEYGILYANGADTKDLVHIITFENIIKFLISFIIMMPILLLLAKKFFSFSYKAGNIVLSMIVANISWKVLLVGVLIVFLSSWIPIHTIKKYTPVELIR